MCVVRSIASRSGFMAARAKTPPIKTPTITRAITIIRRPCRIRGILCQATCSDQQPSSTASARRCLACYIDVATRVHASQQGRLPEEDIRRICSRCAFPQQQDRLRGGTAADEGRSVVNSQRDCYQCEHALEQRVHHLPLAFVRPEGPRKDEVHAGLQDG